MGKDNSCSKSNLQLQRERINEELINFNNSITKALRTIEKNIEIEEKAKWLLELYQESAVKEEKNMLNTEKLIVLQAEKHIDLSEYERFLTDANKELQESQYGEIKKQYFEKIRTEIISKMERWIDLVLKKMNQEVVVYTFYLKSMQIQSIYFGDYNFKLHVELNCKIDIR